jgi:hypothetical protein
MEWKDIKGYEGSYQVSNTGMVRSLDRAIKFRWFFRYAKGRILKVNIDKYGYEVVSLQDGTTPKYRKVHRLVAEAFIGESELTVNHKDFNKRNNHVDNLEYLTASENSKHARANKAFNLRKGNNHPNYRITEEVKKEIVNELKRGIHYKDVAIIYNIHPVTVLKIKRLYSHLSY